MKLQAWHSSGNTEPALCSLLPSDQGKQRHESDGAFTAEGGTVHVDMRVGGLDRSNDLRLTLTGSDLAQMLDAIHGAIERGRSEACSMRGKYIMPRSTKA